jgi:hypothetical protein
MGQRANYIIIDDHGFVLKYSHWGANAIDGDMFWGPAHALAFINAQRDTDEWLDDIWCEGGALVDLPKRTMLWFGGEDIVHDVMRHRLYMALLARTWPGWSVRCAFEGLCDVVDHLGLARDPVRSGRERKPRTKWVETGRWNWGVYTLRRTDGRITAHVSPVRVDELFHFPADVLASFVGAPSCELPLEGDLRPAGGAHIDETERRIDLWSPEYAPDLSTRVWPGWRLEHHGGRFEDQLERAGGALVLTPASQASAIEGLVASLMYESKVDPHGMLAAMMKGRDPEKIEVNPLFFEHVPIQLSPDDKSQILKHALAGLPLQPGFT